MIFVLSLLGLAGYGRTVFCGIHATVRIILSHEKWPTQADPFPRRSDIRSANLGQFSRPMTGHTPQKLPFFRRNLLHHRSARAECPYTRSIMIPSQAAFVNYYFSKNKTPTISEYIKKSQSKTAALFVTALKSLADLKAQNNTKTMENFANHFGIAFQIKDDIKNFICNETQKPTFNDLEAGIYTAPVIYTFGENSDITELSTNEILNKIQNSNAMNQTQNLLNTYLNQALKDIDFVSENNYKQAIICLCKMLESK